MTLPTAHSTIGVLASGGLDSSILLAHLLQQERCVHPFYVRSQLYWEQEELASLQAFLHKIASPSLEELTVLDLPLGDLYGDHWSTNGHGTPDAQSPDEAVYLPGRNALLAIKPMLWCAMHNIEQLALAVLASNPFSDATDAFFRDYESAMRKATGRAVQIVRPFAQLEKGQVIELGCDLPLELTFSCIAPVNGLHCGQCNKCAERQKAFTLVGIKDPTQYV